MAEYIEAMRGEHRDEVVICPRCARLIRVTTTGWEGRSFKFIRETFQWRCPCGCYGPDVYGPKRVYQEVPGG